MNWKKLKDNRCPSEKCGKDLALSNISEDPATIECKCGFKISAQRFAEIVGGIISKTIDYAHISLV